MRPLAPFIAFASIAFVSACASSSSSGSGSSAAAVSPGATSSGKKTWTCVLCGEEIAGAGQTGYYGAYELHFCSKGDAEQFVSLPRDKKAKLAAPQVLEAKKITNKSCPLTGEELTAAAAPVVYESQIIGFATVADANQFKSLPAAKQKDLIAKWRTQAGSTT